MRNCFAARLALTRSRTTPDMAPAFDGLNRSLAGSKISIFGVGDADVRGTITALVK